MRELYNFTMKKDDDPVEKIYAMEDFREKLNNARISVDDNTLYTCVVSALPPAGYTLEIRDLNLKQVYDRKEIINLVRSTFENFGTSKGSADPLAPAGKEGSGQRKKGGKTQGGQGRSEKGKEGNGNANSKGGAGKA